MHHCTEILTGKQDECAKSTHLINALVSHEALKWRLSHSSHKEESAFKSGVRHGDKREVKRPWEGCEYTHAVREAHQRGEQQSLKWAHGSGADGPTTHVGLILVKKENDRDVACQND